MGCSMRRFFYFLILIALLFLTSCISAPPLPTPVGPTVTYNPFATLSPTPFGPLESTPTALPTAIPSPTLALPTPTAPPPPGTRPKYTIQVMLDYAGHGLSVDETVFYPNSTGVMLDSLVLAVEPNRLDGCFSLAAFSGERVSGYSLDGARLEVRLDPPLAADEFTNLSLRFNLSLPLADHHHIFGYKADQINLVDWYPFVVPYRDGWLLHPAGDVGEHLVYEAADFDVTITPTGSVTALVMAGSVPALGQNFRLNSARSFAVSISDRFLQSSRQVAGVTLTSYYFSGEQVQGERLLEEVGQALLVYSGRFGPYPYPALSIVESDFYDGLEYDGLFFLSRDFYLADDGTKLNYLVDIAVHETAHQWWFGEVGNDQALEPWLDEALATYSEYLFYEQTYPGMAEAWWQFRVDAFSPTGYVDSTIYTTSDFQAYADAVYLRGAEFLRDLRLRLGDEAFFAFLRDYAAQMNGKIATADDFFRILATHTDADLSDLLHEYFQNR
jgi:Peptidase family M1 domain